MNVEERFIPLLNEALEKMNKYDFEYYLAWKDRRFKTKWDVVRYNCFQSYLGGTSLSVEGADISFEPVGLTLKLNDSDKCFIPIEECKQIFEQQGKQIYVQESLF